MHTITEQCYVEGVKNLDLLLGLQVSHTVYWFCFKYSVNHHSINSTLSSSKCWNIVTLGGDGLETSFNFKRCRLKCCAMQIWVSRVTTPFAKLLKMAECEETCKNEIDGVLEPLDADILDSEEELQHAFAEAIEEVSSPRLG